MADDPIQSDLGAWARQGDKAAGDRAVLALSREARPRIARFMKDAASDRVDDTLQAALVHLCAFGPGGPAAPRALAPDGHGNAGAHRREVLKNFLIDQWKKLDLRIHGDTAEQSGWTPETFAAERRAQRQARERETEARLRPLGNARHAASERSRAPFASDNDVLPEATPAIDEPDASAADVAPRTSAASPANENAEGDLIEQIARSQQRGMVVATLAKLPPRRAMAAALGLRADPTPFVHPFARDRKEDIDDVRARVQRAVEDYDAGGAGLTDAMVRVLYPTGPLPVARDSARVMLEHATTDLRRHLADHKDQDAT
jgi:hypothetical protein